MLSVEQLSKGKSFNNRIYFINTTHNGKRVDLALKVTGIFFAPTKVENEVSSLLLLQKFCPKVPCPKVKAWSLDGRICHTVVESEDADEDQLVRARETTVEAGLDEGRSWILMDRLPGERLEIEDVFAQDKAEAFDLMKQIASCMHSWRTEMPAQTDIGNLRLFPVGKAGGHSTFCITVAGLVLCDDSSRSGLWPSVDYYKRKVRHARKVLETKPAFSGWYGGNIERLIDEFLALHPLNGFSLFSTRQTDVSHFTHFDLSPRNILIQNDAETGKGKVSGILDFEFSGYFPEEEEFINDAVANLDDWPPEAYDVLLSELERLGTRVPPHGTSQNEHPLRFRRQHWQEALTLTMLIEDIAPWHLAEGGTQGAELDIELSKAVSRVKKDIADLTKLFNSSYIA